ncbi:hypothetical protein SAMN05192558_102109 [Actinokineospora alba]|uniref:Uncharacterized protein n=1 Tax=Actinokineospora alba TaxID=504798 RepID=A0A1H0HGE7_9PSEU|nr:hypothetical protein [Actinokineospora alba]TDP64893.1 hypothetical protein C8E96_0370 [Actinokineospora alba]SDH48592.1 hypothetical protein SAMN05421871_101194 [Actinokineospora alba]SDO18286.1 hypothetical protein SAMN05192558_102109 [Actinokineospora alba]
MVDSKRNNRPDDSPIPLVWQDGLVKTGSLNAMILGVFIAAFTVVGLVVAPHWLWAAPLACTAAAFGVNHRMRQATRYSQVAVLGAITLALLIGAGTLLVLIAQAMR